MVTRINSTYTLLAPWCFIWAELLFLSGPFYLAFFVAFTWRRLFWVEIRRDLGAYTTPHVSLSISLSRPYQMGRVTLKFGPYLK